MSLPINPLVARVLEPPTGETRAWVAEGPRNSTLPLIDAAQAVPAYPPAKGLMEHLSRFALEPESAFYTPILGVPALREALARDLSSDYGANIAPENVAITSGGNHAFCMAVLSMAGAGDEVILAEPYYFNHQMWLDMQGITVRPLPCRETEDGMVPSPEDAERLITPATRLIALVTPNNPTGTIYPPGLLQEFNALARRRGIGLVVDETYKDFLMVNAPAHGLFGERGWGNSFVHLYSFSKVFSLTGYRVGALVGGSDLIEAVSKVADTLTICPSRIGQEAALYGLHHLSGWRTEKREDLLRRIALLDDAFETHRPDFALVSRGAFFAYLRHPYPGTKSLDVSRRLFDEVSLLTWPGSFFGADQEDYVRLAFANADANDIAEMVRRLAIMSSEA